MKLGNLPWWFFTLVGKHCAIGRARACDIPPFSPVTHSAPQDHVKYLWSNVWTWPTSVIVHWAMFLLYFYNCFIFSKRGKGFLWNNWFIWFVCTFCSCEPGRWDNVRPQLLRALLKMWREVKAKNLRWPQHHTGSHWGEDKSVPFHEPLLLKLTKLWKNLIHSFNLSVSKEGILRKMEKKNNLILIMDQARLTFMGLFCSHIRYNDLLWEDFECCVLFLNKRVIRGGKCKRFKFCLVYWEVQTLVSLN